MPGDSNQTGPDRSGSEHIQTETISEALTSSHRRHILFHLRQNGAATESELVEVVEAMEGSHGSDEENVETAVHHVHLPKLAELDLVRWDRTHGIVELVAGTTSLGEWLDLAARGEFTVSQLTEEEEASPAGAEPIDVLYIDDDRETNQFIEDYFDATYERLDVETVADARAALDVLAETTYDCIVSDYDMPGVSGLDLLNTIREADPDVPFVLFTGKGSEQLASESIKHGVSDYVVKTGDARQFDTLAERIESVVGTLAAEN